MARLYGTNGAGILPDYFNRDQVGGLTHWLKLSLKAGSIARDVNSYADALEAEYGVNYPKTVITGTFILLEEDKDKMAFMYKELGSDAPTDHESSHSLMSMLLLRAVMPWIMRPEIARNFFLKQSTLDRAVGYAEKFYIPAQDLGQPWFDWMKG